MGSAAVSLHIVVFPFMAQGHTLPLLDLSNRLALLGIKVTIITTPANFPSIHSKVSRTPEISISVIPFLRGVDDDGALQGVENTSQLPSDDMRAPFIQATKKLKQPFEKILEDMFEAGCPPIAVISDFFLGWTLDSCNSFGIPRIVTYGMSALSQALLMLSTVFHIDYIMGLLPEDVVEFPELSTPFRITRADFLLMKHDPRGSSIYSIIQELTEAELRSWGVLVNSFEDIESRENIAALESLYYGKEVKAWCVGPLLLSDQIFKQEKEKEEEEPCIEWLEEERIGYASVLYVSFGSEAKVSEEQLDEIAFGLEMAAQPFIWVVKSKTWVAPPGWEERVKLRGLVVKSWVEQRRILSHPKIGGFLSHCGWNSVLEGLSMGVPLLAWPIAAEQSLNAKIVADWLGAGIRVFEMSELAGSEIIIGRKVISEKVRELMAEERGRKARERAHEVKRMAWEAMKKGGSSDRKLNELIKTLASIRKDNI